MGSREACYALTHFLPNLKFVIPMFYNIVPGYPQIQGRPERLMDLIAREVLPVQMLTAKSFKDGKALVEKVTEILFE